MAFTFANLNSQLAKVPCADVCSLCISQAQVAKDEADRAFKAISETAKREVSRGCTWCGCGGTADRDTPQ